MNLEKLCLQVVDIAREVGQFINQQQNNLKNSQIEIKGENDFVTYVDKTAEQQIVLALEKLLPESGFIAEEQSSTKVGQTYNWIIDPLDGTTNFIHGLKPYAVSIALQRHEKTILGVVYEVGLDEAFYAWEGAQAKLNGLNISVSGIKNVKQSLLATGFPYNNYRHLNEFMESLAYFMQNSHGLRRLGTAATDLAYVAAGRFEGFYEYSLKPWDVAAGAFIVHQAGGKVCDFSGGENYIHGQEIVASSAAIFTEFSEIIKNFIKK